MPSLNYGISDDSIGYVCTYLSKQLQACYLPNGCVITDSSGNAMASLKQGECYYAFQNKICDISEATRKPLAIPDEMDLRFKKINARYRDAVMTDTVILAVTNTISDKALFYCFTMLNKCGYRNIYTCLFNRGLKGASSAFQIVDMNEIKKYPTVLVYGIQQLRYTARETVGYLVCIR